MPGPELLTTQFINLPHLDTAGYCWLVLLEMIVQKLAVTLLEPKPALPFNISPKPAELVSKQLDISKPFWA